MIPKVSILVPIFNVSSFIERCAVSLFEQTFEDIEYIFVNDCTPDNSIEVLNNVIQRYPNRQAQIRIINHENNKGLAGARNTGIANANGDFILHIDSDDYVEPNMVELLYSKAIAENSDIVVCDFIMEWDNTNRVVEQIWDKNPKIFINKILSVQAVPSVWNKLFKKKLYIENNISTIEGINLGEDLITTPKLLYYSKNVSKVGIPLCHYIQTNSNSYTKNYTEKNINNVEDVLKELTSFFKNKEDFYLFEQSLLEGKLKKKIELIFNSDEEYWNELFKIFPEINKLEDLSFLTIRENIVYFFIKNNYNSALSWYKKMYNPLFNAVQKLKGR